MSQISFTGPDRLFSLNARKLEGISESSFTRYCSVTLCVGSALSFPFSWARALPTHASAKDEITTGKSDHPFFDICIVHPRVERVVRRVTCRRGGRRKNSTHARQQVSLPRRGQ